MAGKANQLTFNKTYIEQPVFNLIEQKAMNTRCPDETTQVTFSTHKGPSVKDLAPSCGEKIYRKEMNISLFIVGLNF